MNELPGLFGDLHDELVVLLEAEVEDAQVDGGAHVVNVGHEHKLPPLVHQLGQQAGVVERLVKVAVTRRVPTKMVLHT